MNADAWKRVEEIYHAAIELEPADRAGFLQQASAGDEGLRHEVETLLQYDEPAAVFIETPAFELVAKQWASDASSEGAPPVGEPSPVPEQIGAYQLLRPLARGGMGEVYLAIDTRLKRKVAIKLMPLNRSADIKRAQRFEQEALAASALNHPNILTVYEIGQIDGRNYIVTEYVEGETLRERITDQPGCRTDPADAVRIALQIASALEAAHEAGIVHRDIKPENVMVRPDGLVKVLDFGLAKIAPSQDEHGGLLERLSTQSGIVMGTAAYMSPEQARGQDLDHRSDIFSLGVVLYEMLGRCRPFDGPTASDVIAAVLTRDPAPLSDLCPDVSAGLQRIVSGCLEKDPEKRFQSAGELRSALEALSSTPEPEPVRSSSFSRLPWGSIIIGLFLVWSLAVALISLYRSEEREPHTGVTAEYPERTPGGSKQRNDGPGANFAFTVPDGWILSWSDAPAVSPDGRYVVFSALPTSAEVGREVSLWVRDLDSAEPKLLPGTEGGTSPFWSPDSRFVAFWAKGMLRKIQISGGAISTVCRSGRGFAGTWSQDGVILFPTLVALGSRLSRVPASGGQAVTMDSFAEGETARYDPRFLPDGGHFLYYSQNLDSQLNGLYVASLDSGRDRRLVLRNAGSAAYVSPGFLLFSRGNVLMAQRFDLQRLVLAGEAVPVAQGVASYASGTSPPFSAFSASDNGLLVWKMQAGDAAGTELTWFDRSGRRLGTVGGQSEYSGPALSPDESRLAVARVERGTEGRDLWVFNLLRGTGSRLTSDPADDFNPVWSPDGNSIIFTSNRVGPRNIYRVSASGGEVDRRLESREDKHVEDISPDGRFLIFNSRTAVTNSSIRGSEIRGKDLYLTPLNEWGKQIRFLATRFREDQAQFSPDGRWVAYCSDETDDPEVFVRGITATGTGSANKWRVSRNGGNQPRWRGDGKELFYLEGNTLMRVPVESQGAAFSAGPASPLFSADIDKEERRNRYLVTKDGRRFLVIARTRVAADSTIGVELDWLAALRQ